MYDAQGNITRAGAEQVIRDGGTVHMKGKEYRTIQALPSEAEFAAGDPAATQKALDGLAAQRAALDDQEKKLHAENARLAQAKKDADAAQKDREKRQGEQPPQTLHQQFGGRQLAGSENPLAEEEANAAADRAKAAAEAADPARRTRADSRSDSRTAADDEAPKAGGHRGGHSASAKSEK